MDRKHPSRSASSGTLPGTNSRLRGESAVGHYQPIEDYGVVGDLHTVALVGKDGSIDFMAFPHFDSPTMFAAILDSEKGGRFQIKPCLEGGVHKQMYLPDTNVLITRLLSDEGVAEVSDFMPVGAGRRRAPPRPSCAGPNACGARSRSTSCAIPASTTGAPVTRSSDTTTTWSSRPRARTAPRCGSAPTSRSMCRDGAVIAPVQARARGRRRRSCSSRPNKEWRAGRAPSTTWPSRSRRP